MSEQFSMGESHHKHPKNLSKNYQKVHESHIKALLRKNTLVHLEIKSVRITLRKTNAHQTHLKW